MAVGDRVYIADKETLDNVELNMLKSGMCKASETVIDFPSLPYLMSKHTTFVVYNGEVHALGGDVYTSQLLHYKYSNGSWVSVSTLPYAFYAGAAVVYKGYIYIIGGGSSSNSYRNTYRWSEDSTWTKVGSTPYDFYNGAAVVYNDKIYLLGGTASSTRVASYSDSTDTWIYETSNPIPYTFSSIKNSAVVYNNEIHILGGSSSNTMYNHYKYNGTSWTSVSTIPVSLNNGFAVVYKGSIYIVNTDGFYIEFYKYNSTTSWIKIDSKIPAFVIGLVVTTDEIHLFLDNNSSRNYLKYHYKYDGQWKDYQYLSKRYYLKAGSRIYCDPTKTVIEGDYQNLGDSYITLSDGFVTVTPLERLGECYTIV